MNPIIKSNNLLNNAIAMQQANQRGGEEALMCNYRGELSECSQSNFFMVREGVLLTPPSTAGLLEGITRGFLFDLARDAGIDAREQTLYPDDLDTADEVFITSTTRELSPVVRIDDRVIGNGTPGPITLDLLTRYRRYAWESTAKARGRALKGRVLRPAPRPAPPIRTRVANASIGGHAQIRLRSPYGLSIRAHARPYLRLSKVRQRIRRLFTRIRMRSTRPR